jgi:hypothetical protein
MLLSAFRFEEIGQFIQDEGPVFDAVATVGALYGNQTNADLCLSPDRLVALHKFCSSFRQHVRTRMQKPHALEDTTLLLSVQLLAILEVRELSPRDVFNSANVSQLMTDKTGFRWAELFQLLQTCFSSQECTLDVSDGVKASFFGFTRLCLAFRDLMWYDKVSSLAGLVKARHNIPVAAGPQKEFPTSPGEKAESLTRMIDFWAQLKVRYVSIIQCGL